MTATVSEEDRSRVVKPLPATSSEDERRGREGGAPRWAGGDGDGLEKAYIGWKKNETGGEQRSSVERGQNLFCSLLSMGLEGQPLFLSLPELLHDDLHMIVVASLSNRAPHGADFR